MSCAPPRPVTPLGILTAKLEHLCSELGRLDEVPTGLKAELTDACALAAGIEPYVSHCTTPESSALRRLAERTRAAEWVDSGLEQEMLSGHVEGRTLAFLVKLTRSQRVLEIGMFTGYSALAMAEALPAGGELIACELDADVARFAQECFAGTPAAARIRVEVGPARATLERLAAAGERFDLVFVDAEKTGYLGYVRTVLARDLLAPDGVICVDNTLMQGLPYGAGEPTENGAAIAAFNRAIAEDPETEQVLLPLRDGLTLIRRAR